MPKLKQNLTIGELLGRFPGGFAVSPSGIVFEIKGQAKDRQELPIINGPGGFLVVEQPVVKAGDERFLEGIDSLQGKSLQQIADELDVLLKELEEEPDPDKLHMAYGLYERFSQLQEAGENGKEPKRRPRRAK